MNKMYKAASELIEAFVKTPIDKEYARNHGGAQYLRDRGTLEIVMPRGSGKTHLLCEAFTNTSISHGTIYVANSQMTIDDVHRLLGSVWAQTYISNGVMSIQRYSSLLRGKSLKFTRPTIILLDEVNSATVQSIITICAHAPDSGIENVKIISLRTR